MPWIFKESSTDQSEESKEIVLHHYEATRNESENTVPMLAEHSITDECPLDKYLVSLDFWKYSYFRLAC